jgi:hypothetical protein
VAVESEFITNAIRKTNRANFQIPSSLGKKERTAYLAMRGGLSG